MKLFFAGAESFESLMVKYNCHALMSFFHIRGPWKKNPRIKEGNNLTGELFIDSGAFSAFSLGKPTDIDKYIEFCKKTDADYYAVLDVIGSASGTLKNQIYMEDRGVKPVPCFHHGEDFKYLKYYCRKYDYIALGGMVPISTPALIRWLEVIFTMYPNKKFHGFGVTTKKLIERFPFYSVDSSSWLSGGRVGSLFDMELGTKHYSELTEQWKKKIEERGFTLDEINEKHEARNSFNIISYLEMQDKHAAIKGFQKQHQLNKFFNVPEKKEAPAPNFKEWIAKHYGDVPPHIAKKLIKHQFGVDI